MTSNLRSLRELAERSAIYGLVFGLPGLLAEALLTTSAPLQGTLRFISIWAIFVPVVAILALPLMLLGCLIPQVRGLAARRLMVCAIFVFFFVCMARIARDVRMGMFTRLADRSQPLVSALHEFERLHGAPANELADLVPSFLKEVPETGLAPHPKYRYVSGEDAQLEFGTRWALCVDCSLGLLNWDMFYYVPSKNYPEYGHGGRIERVGNWAYVHE